MSALTTPLCSSATIGSVHNGPASKQETIMKTHAYVTSGLVAVVIGGAIALAPIAGAATLPAPMAGASAHSAIGDAGTDPLVPYGTEPQVPYRLGYVDSNHDEANTTAGHVDLPF
jgi:hypothetical protein